MMSAWPRRLRRSKLPQWDKDFVRLHLDEQGQFLFYQMDPADQRHALAVAKAVLAKRGYKPGVSVEPLVQAALLHDVGKVAGDLNRFTRIIVGLIRRLAPGLRSRWADRGGSRLKRACHTDVVHATRGAYMALTFGIDQEVAAVIRAHHDPPAPGESMLLTYLREADREN